MIGQQQENKANWFLWFRRSHHWRNLFHFWQRENEKSSFDRPNYTSIQVFHFKISVKKKRRKEIRFGKQKFWKMTNFITSFMVKQFSSKQVHSSSSSWITIRFRLEGSWGDFSPMTMVQLLKTAPEDRWFPHAVLAVAPVVMELWAERAGLSKLSWFSTGRAPQWPLIFNVIPFAALLTQ